MPAHSSRPASRALVLGGGGVTGIAWETGVLTGLLDEGVDLRQSDIVIGTSAGAFVGAAVASGQDMDRMFAAQLAANSAELTATASPKLYAAWLDAFTVGGSDPCKVGLAFGAIAKADPEPVPYARRRAVVRARLATTDWPDALRVTAINADTGELHAFGPESGLQLEDAVSASGAVPGLSPIEHFDGHTWIDGGMVSSTNAALAAEYARIVILAPMPAGYGEIPGAAEDAATLSRNAQVELITPDDSSLAAIGLNPYDPQHRAPAAQAGRHQGAILAATIAAMWLCASAYRR